MPFNIFGVPASIAFAVEFSIFGTAATDLAAKERRIGSVFFTLLFQLVFTIGGVPLLIVFAPLLFGSHA